MILLDCRRHRTPDADAVATHLQGLCLARLIEEGCAHRRAVLRAEREDLPCLDAAPDVEMSVLADGAFIAFLHEADVRHRHRAKVALRIHVRIVEVCLVRTGDGIVHPHRRLVDDDMRPLLDADRAHKAGTAARRTDRFLVCHAQLARARNGIRELDFVDLMVTAQECEDECIVLRLIGNRLDRLFDRNLEIFCKQGYRMRSGRCHLLERQHLFVGSVDGTQRRLLVARRIAARITARNA